MTRRSARARTAAILLVAATFASGAHAADGDFIAEPPKEAVMTSEIGAVPVFAADGREAGDVENVVLGFDGRIVAVVVGLGGTLGLGERLIAVPIDRITFSKGEDGPRADTADTLQVLRDAPTFSQKTQ